MTRLRQVMELVGPQLSRAATFMWSAEPARERYLDWLGASHDLIRATGPLLAEAVSECVRRGEGELAAYFGEQLTEEFGHDRWVEQDWVAAGQDRAAFAARVPLPAAARLAGAQYYWIRHAHPVALTGHIAMLEWQPPSAGLPAKLMARTGLPVEAFRTLARHAELDTGHGRQLDKLLDRLSLTGQQQRLVTTSAMTTALGLVELMTELGRLP
jgi:hypothetical protein